MYMIYNNILIYDDNIYHLSNILKYMKNFLKYIKSCKMLKLVKVSQS